MEERDTTLTIARYVIHNSDVLGGLLREENYFLVGGKGISERSYSPFQFFKGFAVDILADRIENHGFFGWHIPENPDYATNNSNIRVRSVLKEVWQDNPWVLKPIEDFYKVDISARLADDKVWKRLSY